MYTDRYFTAKEDSKYFEDRMSQSAKHHYHSLGIPYMTTCPKTILKCTSERHASFLIPTGLFYLKLRKSIVWKTNYRKTLSNYSVSCSVELLTEV